MGNSLDRWWNAIRQQHTRSLDRSPENIRDRCGPPLLPPPLLAGAVVVPRTAGFRSVPAAPGGSERGRGRLRREGRGGSDHALQEPQPGPAGYGASTSHPTQGCAQTTRAYGQRSDGPFEQPPDVTHIRDQPTAPCVQTAYVASYGQTLPGRAGAQSACPGHGPGSAMPPRLQLLPPGLVHSCPHVALSLTQPWGDSWQPRGRQDCRMVTNPLRQGNLNLARRLIAAQPLPGSYPGKPVRPPPSYPPAG